MVDLEPPLSERLIFSKFLGVISWDEYHRYFLKQQGFDSKYLKSHDKRHVELSRRLRETIMRDKAAWSEAARSDPDHLTVDEFLAFRHPESSHATILALVEDLIEKFGTYSNNFFFL